MAIAPENRSRADHAVRPMISVLAWARLSSYDLARPPSDGAGELMLRVRKVDAHDVEIPRTHTTAATGNAATRQLTPEQQAEVRELQTRDREVRAHEQAHKAAAGAHARGGPTFTYQRGPDGRQYAIGGEVAIDTSPVRGDPEGTVRKMEQIQRAAAAPAEPSGQDRQVAAQAAAQAARARAEVREERRDASEAEAAEKPAERDEPGRFVDVLA